MKYGLIKNCKMSWETEEHTFTFSTGGDRLCALDSLGDVIGSLRDLYVHIRDNTDYDDAIPSEYRVTGGHSYTDIKGLK